jgi:hypothetical protein
MPGVFEVSRGLSAREVIDDVVLLTECSLPGEWEGQVRYFAPSVADEAPAAAVSY